MFEMISYILYKKNNGGGLLSDDLNPLRLAILLYKLCILDPEMFSF